MFRPKEGRAVLHTVGPYRAPSSQSTGMQTPLLIANQAILAIHSDQHYSRLVLVKALAHLFISLREILQDAYLNETVFFFVHALYVEENLLIRAGFHHIPVRGSGVEGSGGQ